MVAFRWLKLAAAVFAAGIGTAQAQAAIELHHVSLAEADFGDARLAAREFGLRLRSREFAFAHGRLELGADYTYTHYDYTGLPTRNRDLHRVQLPLTWTGGTDLQARVSLAPTVATSSNVFQDLFARGNSDDLALYGHIGIERAPVQGWGWRAGAAYDDAFGDPRVYPVLALLRRNERLAIELGWPRTRVGWQAQPRLRLGLDIAPAGGRWHVVSDERGGAQFHYTTEAWRTALSAQWTFAPRWYLDAQAGVEFDRHHDFEDDTGARIDRDVDSTGLFGLELRYRF